MRRDWEKSRRQMWASFWAHSGSKQFKVVEDWQRATLLYRTVSGGRFESRIAEELDRVHCQMLAFVLPCARLVTETIDQYCRRRCTNARNVAMHAGMWSDVWRKRIINWNYHLERACNYHHMCSRLQGILNRCSHFHWHQTRGFLPPHSSSNNL